MTKEADEVERVAPELIDRFGEAAVYLARDLAERVDGERDEAAQAWHDLPMRSIG